MSNENRNVFDFACDKENDYEFGVTSVNGGDFYLRLYYSCFLDNIKSNDKNELLKSVIALKRSEYREIVGNLIAGTENSYINLAKELIRENVDLSQNNLFRHFKDQEKFNYIALVCFIYDMVKDSTKFKKLLPTLLLLKDCNLRRSLEILGLLTLVIEKNEDWLEKIDLRSMANRLLLKETTSSIVYLTDLLDDESKSADIAGFFSCYVDLVDSYKGDTEEILDLFVNSVKDVFYDDLALDCYFNALSSKIDRPNYYSEEWLKMFFNIVPVVFKKIREENKYSYWDKTRCYDRLRIILKHDDYFAVLASMHFTIEELSESNFNFQDIERKIRTSPLLETYLEYVVPISDSDYEEEVDLEMIYQMHRQNSNYKVVFEQVINQLVNKENFDKKIKVYVVPRRTN